jgi:flagellar protein FliS
MPSTNPWLSYQQIATQTASPAQLVLMLYDGAIRFLEQARLGFEEEDPLEFNRTINNNVIRAQTIINELNYSLNMDAGQDCAGNLRRLYDYLDRKLQESNQHKSVDGIQEVLQRLATLRDAWQQMIHQSLDAKNPSTHPTLAAAA